MTDEGKRCPWTIRYGRDEIATTRCLKDEHLDGVATHAEFVEHAFDLTVADLKHEGEGFFPGQLIEWYAGDRREYVGEWPGYCHRQPCNLPEGHMGDDAP